MVPLPSVLRERLDGGAWEREPEGESGGVIYRLRAADGSRLFLKYGEGPVADAIVDEAVRLRWLRGRMLAANPVAFVAERDAAWLLSEAVAGRTGDAWLADDPAMLPRVIAAFAAFLHRLHALPVEDCAFEAGAAVRLAEARRRVAAGLVDEDDFDADHCGMSAAAMLAQTERLAPCVSGRVVTHGDCSLGNLLMDAEGRVTGCIDVGRLGIADPYQDIAILWQNLGDWGSAAQATFLAKLGIDEVDERRLSFHRCLDELF